MKGRAAAVVARLLSLNPDVRPRLDFRNDYELLVATILAAQCTDEQVNKVTPALFERYPDPAALAAAPIAGLERMIHSTGFFRQKAKSLKAAAGVIVERHGGRLPRTIDGLATLPGVGRKTANVVAGLAFGAPAVMVDTHLKRVARRLDLTVHDDPARIEADLRRLVAAERQTRFSMAANAHGRLVCRARKPLCGECPLADLCRWPGRTGASR